jgi:hypothetical protein
MLAPKPPSMPAAPPPVVAQDVAAEADLDEQEAVFNPGSELDDMSMASAVTKQKQGKSSLKTHDTGLAIPL